MTVVSYMRGPVPTMIKRIEIGSDARKLVDEFARTHDGEPIIDAESHPDDVARAIRSLVRTGYAGQVVFRGAVLAAITRTTAGCFVKLNPTMRHLITLPWRNA